MPPDVRGARRARRSWSYRLIRKAMAPVPPFGSREWVDLPEGSAERIASVVVAAEAWATDRDELPAHLAYELDAMRAESKRLDDDAYVARYRAHRRDFKAPTRPSFAERRAAQLEGESPRPGDFVGAGGRHE
ncbi:MAG: hypothetical protein ACR2KG_12140 [Nocardioidaceae bacterium]